MPTIVKTDSNTWKAVSRWPFKVSWSDGYSVGRSHLSRLELAYRHRSFKREFLMKHQGACHCGAVRLTIPSTPEVATACNCSLCRRIGGPWVYFELGTVTIEGHPESTEAYIQGDRTMRTIRCRHCGCVTHWEPISQEAGAKHGVHFGNFDPQLIAAVRVRKFDGADTWRFLEP